MNKRETIYAILNMLLKTDDFALIDLIFQLLKQSE